MSTAHDEKMKRAAWASYSAWDRVALAEAFIRRLEDSASHDQTVSTRWSLYIVASALYSAVNICQVQLELKEHATTAWFKNDLALINSLRHAGVHGSQGVQGSKGFHGLYQEPEATEGSVSVTLWFVRDGQSAEEFTLDVVLATLRRAIERVSAYVETATGMRYTTT
jgi:hypothetical protein